MNNKRVVILISGSGSNLQAFIDAQNEGILNGNIVAVLSNNADAFGLTRAKKANIDTILVKHSDFSSREDFDLAMIKEINLYQPDLIILAGFMRILSAEFVKNFSGKLLNIHPSLLPKYPGLHTHARAKANNEKHHGTSVHFVTEELDGGPVIAQAIMNLDINNTTEEIAKKVQLLEHKLYPQVASWFLNNRLSMREDGIYFDNKKIQLPITM